MLNWSLGSFVLFTLSVSLTGFYTEARMSRQSLKNSQKSKVQCRLSQHLSALSPALSFVLNF